MKKVLLTAALGCTMITGAYADQNSGLAKYSITVQDNISIQPNGGPYDLGNIWTFTSGADMATGVILPGTPTEFIVNATRSFKVVHIAGDFNRTGPGALPAHVDQVVPSSLIMKVKTVSSNPLVDFVTPGFIPVSGAPGNLVLHSTGGAAALHFTGQDKFTPGDAFGIKNMSGIYEVNTQYIATLD